MKRMPFNNYKTISELINSKKNCMICKEKLSFEVASGKYDDILNFGHAGKTLHHRLTKTHLTVKRSTEIDKVNVSIEYKINLKTNELVTKLTPSDDELIAKFPIANSFLELDDAKLHLSIESGMINVFRILKRFVDSIFIIQECPKHYKRISFVDITESGDSLYDVDSYDEFVYIPTMKNKSQMYGVHDHCSPLSHNRRNVFIQVVDGAKVEYMDPKRGGTRLDERDDAALMDFDYSNPEKLARKLGMIMALREG